MYFTTSILLSSLALAQAFTGPAPIVDNNPLGVTYTAVLPNRNSTTIRGYIAGTSASNGTGVNFNINLFNLPPQSEGGPVIYHIHDQPIPADGNCTKALAHLDPTQRGELPLCDPTQPATCQVGDLSGKHGNITQSPFQAAYLDLYLSTAQGPGAFFGNRSIVVHSSNTTRLTCANFVLTGGNSVIANGTNGTVGGGPSPTPSSFVGGATNQVVSAVGVMAIAGLVAMVL